MEDYIDRDGIDASSDVEWLNLLSPSEKKDSACCRFEDEKGPKNYALFSSVLLAWMVLVVSFPVLEEANQRTVWTSHPR